MAERSEIPYVKRAWLEVEKIEIDGEYRYKIKDFWAEHPFRLPKSYLDGYPHFYEVLPYNNKDSLAIRLKPYHHYVISRGDVLTESEFLQVIKAMREAGRKLTKIMKGKRKKIYKKMLKQIKNNPETGTYRIEI